MSLLPGSLNPIERTAVVTGVRRVERDRGADEFNQKQQDQRRKGQAHHDAEEEELPQDVVDLSGNYVVSNLPAPVPVSSAVTLPAPVSKPEVRQYLSGLGNPPSRVCRVRQRNTTNPRRRVLWSSTAF
jgi:hypothetical protein